MDIAIFKLNLPKDSLPKMYIFVKTRIHAPGQLCPPLHGHMRGEVLRGGQDQLEEQED